jgi:hypothetical protein
MRLVPRWRESDVFTPLERDVMEYAEAMSLTPPTVTDEMSARLRMLARRREEYVGQWLPEPLPTSPDVAEDVELAESVSIAIRPCRYGGQHTRCRGAPGVEQLVGCPGLLRPRREPVHNEVRVHE